MFCIHCGKEIRDDSLFCEHCGGRLEKMQQDTGRPSGMVQSLAKCKVLWNNAQIGRKIAAVFSDLGQIFQKPKARLAAVMTAGALALVCILGLLLAALTGGTKTIYVMDGKAIYTDGSEKYAEMYEYRFTDDGLPMLRYHLQGDSALMSDPCFYAYDYSGYVAARLEFIEAKPELSQEVAARQEEILEKKLAEFLYAQNYLPISTSTEWLAVQDDCVTVKAGNSTFWKYEYDKKGNVIKNTFYVNDKVHSITKCAYTRKGELALYELTYGPELGSMSGTTYRYEYTYGKDNARNVVYTELLNGEVKYTAEYQETQTFDSNDLLTGIVRKNGDTEIYAVEYRYHFRKLEVPAASVKLLCSVYDRLGIEYVRAGLGVSVEDTLPSEELSSTMMDAIMREW